MPQQTRKWDDQLGQAIGLAALRLGNVKQATADLHAGRLDDFGPVPMPYSTVTYYAKRERRRLEQEAQEQAERDNPPPLDERIDAGAKALLTMLESEIERMGKAKTKNVKLIGETAASLKKVRELAKPDGPSKPSSKPEEPTDPLTAALTRPSPREPKNKGRTKETTAPKVSIAENGTTPRPIEDTAGHEDGTMSGVPSRSLDWSRPLAVDPH